VPPTHRGTAELPLSSAAHRESGDDHPHSIHAAGGKSTRHDLCQLAVRKLDITRLLDRVPAADWARFTLKPDCLAFRTLQKLRRGVCAAGACVLFSASLFFVQRPFDRVLGQPVLEDRAGMVENNAVGLADSGAARNPRPTIWR
jgi:hypothetical protein